MKRTQKENNGLYLGLTEKTQDHGVSVFGINVDQGSFEPIFELECRYQAQTIIDKLCNMCEEDCPNWKRKINACYRIVNHDKS